MAVARALRCRDHWRRAGRTFPGAAASPHLRQDRSCWWRSALRFPQQRQKVGEAPLTGGGLLLLEGARHGGTPAPRALHEVQPALLLEKRWAGECCFEDYSQAYLRTFSNIATYQLDRNKLEAEFLRLNSQNPQFTFCAPVTDLEVALSDDGPHALTFTMQWQQRGGASPLGGGHLGARQIPGAATGPGATQPHPSRGVFPLGRGLVNIDKLTDHSPKEIRLRKERAAIGHLPIWLATNHFMGEGFWFWVIPLQGKTSLGLVYDNTIFPRERVATPQKLIEWVCQEFPLFARDLPSRKILDHGSFKDFSYGCAQTIHPSRWALSGEAGRFTDPLYSPGSDFIGFHNTLITDAILTTDAGELVGKCQLYELVMRSIYESLLPTYAVSYDALGDQEAFVLKYTWELSVYFSFFVFPFINDLATHRLFALSYLGRFSRLGTINTHLQAFISAYYQWKKAQSQPPQAPRFHDFTALGALRTAESTFYRVGVSVEEARCILDEQLANLKELARYIVAYVSSVVLADERVLTNRAFIERIDLQNLRFDPGAMYDRYIPMC